MKRVRMSRPLRRKEEMMARMWTVLTVAPSVVQPHGLAAWGKAN